MHTLFTALLLAQLVEPAGTLQYTKPPFPLDQSLADSIRFAYLTVPQDHAQPTGRTLRLALAILPALAPQQAVDPIIFIPGGPGMSVVEPWTAEAARSARIALLRADRDFVILDLRGHGLSDPQMCPQLNSAPSTESGNAQQSAFLRQLTACREQLAQQGLQPRFLNASQAAHDIELLRRALGADQVNLFGASYGTRVVAETLRLFPTAIRSAVFLSPVPPAIEHLGDDAAVAPQVLTTIFARCEQSAECHGHFPALRQDYNAIKERLTRNPLVVRVADADVTLDTTVLQTALAQLLTSRQLAASVPMLVHTFATDGMEPASKLASAMSELMRADDVAYGTNLAFHCNDTPIESSTPAWLRSRCPVWVGPQYGDHSPAVLNSDVPALIMVGEFDPRTPPSYAHALAAGLTHAQLLEIPGYGHDLQHPCLSGVQRDFYRAPHNRVDAACLDSLPPLEFAGPVKPSRWVAGLVAYSQQHPLTSAAAASIVLLLLLAAVVALSWQLLPAQRKAGKRDITVIAVAWLLALSAVVLLLALAAALLRGAQQSALMPLIGVPAAWRWTLLLPWILLALVVAITVRSWRAVKHRTRPEAARGR